MSQEQEPTIQSHPDAVIFPVSLRKPLGNTRGLSLASIVMKKKVSTVETAEEFLGIDFNAGGRAHCFPYAAGDNPMVFAARSPHDTLLFPNGHPKEKEPRYKWVEQEDGSRFGYLVEKEVAHA